MRRDDGVEDESSGDMADTCIHARVNLPRAYGTGPLPVME